MRTQIAIRRLSIPLDAVGGPIGDGETCTIMPKTPPPRHLKVFAEQSCSTWVHCAAPKLLSSALAASLLLGVPLSVSSTMNGGSILISESLANPSQRKTSVPDKYQDIFERNRGPEVNLDDYFIRETQQDIAVRQAQKAAKEALNAAGPMAKQAFDASSVAARQAIDAGTPLAKQAIDAAVPMARQALDAAKPVAKQVVGAATPMAKQAIDAAAPVVRQGVGAAVDVAVDTGALPAVTKGVISGVATTSSAVTKAAVSATCAVSDQGTEYRALQERVVQLERRLRECDDKRGALSLGVSAATSRAADLELLVAKQSLRIADLEVKLVQKAVK